LAELGGHTAYQLSTVSFDVVFSLPQVQHSFPHNPSVILPSHYWTVLKRDMVTNEHEHSSTTSTSHCF